MVPFGCGTPCLPEPSTNLTAGVIKVERRCASIIAVITIVIRLMDFTQEI
jgi:hypothetical protein